MEDYASTQLLDTNLTVRIDEIIREMTTKKTMNTNHQELMDELATTILAHIGQEGNDLDDLFHPELTPRQKTFVIACLFPLIREKAIFIEEMKSFRRKTFILMDEVFAKDVYKQANIDIKLQNYEKVSRLSDALEEIETSLIKMISTASTLKQLQDLRPEFMRTVNNKISKAIIHPFLPPVADEVRLKSFFQAIKDYSESDLNNAIDNYQQAMEIINELLEDARSFPTEYSQTLIIPLFEKGLDIVRKEFEDSPAGKPADIEVQSTGKKYPLHAVGENFNLAVVIENEGPGYARQISYRVNALFDNIIVLENEKQLGELKPGEKLIQIPCQVAKPENLLIVEIIIEWLNANGQMVVKFFQIEAGSQLADIDWGKMAEKDPYSLNAVSSEEELVGRKEIIEQLTAKIKANSMGSTFLHGQKRVGKTSIANVLQKRIKNRFSKDFIVVYLECGNFLALTPTETVNNVGRRLCRTIINSDNRLRGLEIPEFRGALTPLTEFLEDVQQIIPEVRIYFIIDEFDELPIELFKRDEVGKAFFLPIRTISNQNRFGFLLVGGEKMSYVINSMGDQLNKFDPLRIDYFSQDKHWQDFVDLIKRPVQPYFEFTDEAINRIYNMTAGNPYFTKLICKTLYNSMVKKRDAHITEMEMEEAIEQSLEMAETNSFQHFWEDGISEKGARQEEISIRRKKILISLGEIARNYPYVTREALIEAGRKQFMEDHVIDAELREFERRQILVEDHGIYTCKARFFEEWLKRRGLRDIMTSFSDRDEEIEERKKQEMAFVKNNEISDLVGNWGSYQGTKISVEDVRDWLNQFGDNRNQRLMFYILKQLKFYGGDVLRIKMKEAHNIIKRDIVHEIQEKKRRRDDILISYLDGPGKSGAQFPRLYAQENKIYMTNVVEQAKILETLKDRPEIKALVFLDDIIGTGNSVIENINQLSTEVGEILNTVELYVIAICGFDKAYIRLEKEIETLPGNWNIHILDMLTDKDRCFSDESILFPTAEERLAARKLAMEYGKTLEKKAPLGYGDVQANVVFESNCPNNCLPILFKSTSEWKPLFKRK